METFHIIESALLGLPEETIKVLRDNDCIIPEVINYVTSESIIFKIWEVYGSEFNEDKDSWRKRWMDNSNILNPILVDEKVKEDNNRLKLLAILSFIQKNSPRKDFNYNNYVLQKFGIKGFKKAISDHKDKPGFNKVYDNCVKLLNK